MPKTVKNFLQDFPFNPDADDTLHLKGIKIGRFRIDELVITGREAAIHAQEILNAAMERSRRSRINAAGTRLSHSPQATLPAFCQWRSKTTWGPGTALPRPGDHRLHGPNPTPSPDDLRRHPRLAH